MKKTFSIDGSPETHILDSFLHTQVRYPEALSEFIDNSFDKAAEPSPTVTIEDPKPVSQNPTPQQPEPETGSLFQPGHVGNITSLTPADEPEEEVTDIRERFIDLSELVHSIKTQFPNAVEQIKTQLRLHLKNL